ncbi:toxin co-regulated pilus biosynthesis Q family protein [Ramlibacter sp. AN1133]|uniref:toxin co-regulated pilus biosynthesis Q family protein n=1 Tax=Ramlibacter sp. AN1133 TaxID=3133429 RepID=UPI0030C597D4
MSAPALTAPAIAFDVAGSDRSVREVLTRWARAAGWSHEPAHWTLDKDFPVEGTAGAEVFGADFKEAARRLLASTELTDRPVQPCFYTNRVVRVIPKAGLCDKTQ